MNVVETIIKHPPVITIFRGINHQTWAGSWHCCDHITVRYRGDSTNPVREGLHTGEHDIHGDSQTPWLRKMRISMDWCFRFHQILTGDPVNLQTKSRRICWPWSYGGTANEAVRNWGLWSIATNPNPTRSTIRSSYLKNHQTQTNQAFHMTKKCHWQVEKKYNSNKRPFPRTHPKKKKEKTWSSLNVSQQIPPNVCVSFGFLLGKKILFFHHGFFCWHPYFFTRWKSRPNKNKTAKRARCHKSTALVNSRFGSSTNSTWKGAVRLPKISVMAVTPAYVDRSLLGDARWLLGNWTMYHVINSKVSCNHVFLCICIYIYTCMIHTSLCPIYVPLYLYIHIYIYIDR